MNTEYKTYNEMVDDYLRKDSTEVFGNFSPEHAKYIIMQFLRKAEFSVEIMSGTFADMFYDKETVLPLLRGAARRIFPNGGMIRIMTVNGKNSTYLDELVNKVAQEHPHPVIEYRPAAYSGPDRLSHFMVVDGKRYRLEAPHDLTDNGTIPEIVKAEVCCNGTKKSSVLIDFFNKAWNSVGATE